MGIFLIPAAPYGRGVVSKNAQMGNFNANEVVPGTGLEPARQPAYAPKAYVYTNFTIRACLIIISDLWHKIYSEMKNRG